MAIQASEHQKSMSTTKSSSLRRLPGICLTVLVAFSVLVALEYKGGRVQFATTVKAQTNTTDLAANALEVTQGIQDLRNSVRLVANKRTFVRFHVSSQGGSARTTATLRVTAAGKEPAVLSPINPGGDIEVVSNPDRGARDSAFLFEIPDGFKTGTVSLRGEVNPVTASRGRSPEETSYDNNAVEVTITFETVPTLRLVIYNIGYSVEGETFFAPDEHLLQMISWIRKAWPVSDVRYALRRELIGNKLPTCGEVNSFLASKRVWDLQNPNSSVTPNTRYYGMVSEGGGFMRGCADGLPGLVSSGPTGVPRDNDGFFGRWLLPDISWGGFYGGHEVAHNLDRFHAEFCDAKAGAPFPYPDGSISPTPAGSDAIYGFDIDTQAIYGPNWKDNMTYCPLQWNSKFTYHGLMDGIQKNVLPEATKMLLELKAEARAEQPPQDRLLVVGAIHPDKNFAELDPMFIIPNAREVKVHTNGTYAIVLRNAANSELLRYRFNPDVMDEESDPTTHIEGEHELEITELVPYVEGTTRVDVEGPGGRLLATVKAGAARPSITVTSPRGGETLSGDTITVSWTASDPDGDPLYFDVQYSPDNGATWEMVDEFIVGHNSLTIDATDIVAGKQALFQVWASDGIHSSSDTVHASFQVPNHPPTVKIVSPGSGTILIAGQTLSLRGSAYDIDAGSLPQNQLQWSSSLNGPLGNGDSVSVANLREGTHTITFTADDGAGGAASAAIQIIVRSATAPPLNTSRIGLVSGGSGFSTTITLRNPSSTATASGTIYFFSSNGKPLGGIVSNAVVPFSIPPSATFTFKTNPEGRQMTGYATIVSDTVVPSVLLSVPGLGTLVTGPSPDSAYAFRAVGVNRSAGTGSDVGVSVVNVGTSPVRLIFSLVDLDGKALRNVNALQVAPGEQLNRLFSELFPELPNFRGTLRIGSLSGGLPSKSISALVVQFGAGQFFEVSTFSYTKFDPDDR